MSSKKKDPFIFGEGERRNDVHDAHTERHVFPISGRGYDRIELKYISQKFPKGGPEPHPYEGKLVDESFGISWFYTSEKMMESGLQTIGSRGGWSESIFRIGDEISTSCFNRSGMGFSFALNMFQFDLPDNMREEILLELSPEARRFYDQGMQFYLDNRNREGDDF